VEALAYLSRRRSATIGFPVTSVLALHRNGTYKADSLSGTC
jgi:hypothetical protein